MFSNKLYVLPIFIALIVSGCEDSNQEASIVGFAGLSEGATVGEARDKLGEYKPGHGPYVWFYHPDNEARRIEAWFIPSEEVGNIDEFKISFIFDVGRTVTGDIVVIWPPELVGKGPKEVMKLTYGDSVTLR